MHTLRLLAIAVAACCSHAAQAVIVHPHPDGLLPGLSAAEFPTLAGTVVEDLVTPFSYATTLTFPTPRPLTGTMSGTVQSQVVKSIDGSFDFYWRITANADSVGLIQRFDIQSFFFTGASHVGLAKRRAERHAAVARRRRRRHRKGKLVLVRRRWATDSFSTASSALFFVDTDAKFYAKTASFSLDSNFATTQGESRGESGLYATFAPAVPEPETYALMLAGLALLAFAVRPRRH